MNKIEPPKIKDVGIKPKHPYTKRYSTKYLVIHNSAYSLKNQQGAVLFDKWHKSPPKEWNSIGYHFVICADGSIEKGREIWAVGAHANNPANKESIGICLAGNFDDENPTDAELKSLVSLCAWLCQEYNLPGTAIKGHRDCPNNSTSCPGKNMYSRMNWLRNSVVEVLSKSSQDVADDPSVPITIPQDDIDLALSWAISQNITDGSNIKGDSDYERFIVWLYRYDQLKSSEKTKLIIEDREEKNINKNEKNIIGIIRVIINFFKNLFQ